MYCDAEAIHSRLGYHLGRSLSTTLIIISSLNCQKFWQIDLSPNATKRQLDWRRLVNYNLKRRAEFGCCKLKQNRQVRHTEIMRPAFCYRGAAACRWVVRPGLDQLCYMATCCNGWLFPVSSSFCQHRPSAEMQKLSGYESIRWRNADYFIHYGDCWVNSWPWPSSLALISQLTSVGMAL